MPPSRDGVTMRIVFMGTPAFAVPSLDALAAAGHAIVAVYTQPPRRGGRGQALTPSPVHIRANGLGVPVETPVSLRDATVLATFASYRPAVVVVAAYGLILPRAVLDVPPYGCVNVHASLLPRWRGAAPVQRAVLAGDTLTGVTIMAMDAGLDTGAMYARVETPIADKTAGALASELATLGAGLLVTVLRDWPVPVPQPDTGVTYAPKVDKSESALDFLISASQVVRQVQAFGPVPGAWFGLRGERIRVLAADPLIVAGARPGVVLDDRLTIGCNPGAIRPTLVQRAGRAAMTPDALLRGFAIPAGTRLNDDCP